MKEKENKKNILSNLDENETLPLLEHRLLLEGYCSEEMADIYKNLSDLEKADLADFFLLERSYGRIEF